MKKVLFLHPAHPEQSMGGAENQISLLIDHLFKNERDVDVYMIYEDLGSPIVNNLSIHLFPLRKLWLGKRFGDRWFLHRSEIEKYLLTVQPDVIYTRMYSSWSGIAAAYANKNNCVHIWALASDNDVIRLQKPFSLRKPLNVIENKWVRFAFENATHIVTQNNFQQNQLKAEYGREGVLLRQSATEYSAPIFYKSGRKFRICWIANLKPLKQPELFIRLAHTFKSMSDVEFVMIGRSEEKYVTLIKCAEDTLSNFVFYGELANDDVNTELVNADILVNTSEYEGFSNVFVQAWMRKTVVVSLNSNPDNLLTEEGLGFLAGTFDNLQTILNSLIRQPELLDTVREKAYQYAIRNHSYEKNVNVVTKLMGIHD